MIDCAYALSACPSACRPVRSPLPRPLVCALECRQHFLSADAIRFCYQYSIQHDSLTFCFSFNLSEFSHRLKICTQSIFLVPSQIYWARNLASCCIKVYPEEVLNFHWIMFMFSALWLQLSLTLFALCACWSRATTVRWLPGWQTDWDTDRLTDWQTD